ncbi:MAG TPA: S8 family serine peptidase [Oscillatoriales cyanobacterium M59_W2019_021]|nr:MAG: peptidase S8 [Cyanobacteria bacterium J055]HIK33690.1 S8 family serine peptidase [Oscillatoriales cyanobacterium M4454_W2019_049]HIK52904.1 S8 family serine peptidase [Oscillatoriales cyanobacterium M59_W2019_021]
MKRSISLFCLASSLWLAASTPKLSLSDAAVAQTAPTDELFYRFYDRQIPLEVRENTIGVAFKATEGGGSRSIPPYLMLQRALMQSGETRGIDRAIEVQPLGDNYAAIALDDGDTVEEVSQLIRQQSYVESTLPVLTLADDPQAEILLPNEIVVSFEAGLSEERQAEILASENLERVRSLRFTQDRAIVRDRSATGLAILQVADRLNDVPGIRSATPNFIQSTPIRQGLGFGVRDLGFVGTKHGHDNLSVLATPNLVEKVKHWGKRLSVSATNFSPNVKRSSVPASLQTPNPQPPNPIAATFTAQLLPQQWHLDSTPQRGEALPRTDIRAKEAWELSNGGEGVVVAVIDSLIQWDNPDLAQRLYDVGDRPDLLPGETSGWDFAQNDGDTRISAVELGMLLPHFRNTFNLDDDRLLKIYKRDARDIQNSEPGLSRSDIAQQLRDNLQIETAAEFHGTWVAGVVAANSQEGDGVLGVAPNAKILPVRVFGVGGAVTSSAIVEAIGYAAARDADAINLSLGRLLPDAETADAIAEITANNPDIVFVASAGNADLNTAMFPAIAPEVIAVGATTLEGQRAPYSNYGEGLDVVAPGGDTSVSTAGGILTTGGTTQVFWENISPPSDPWGFGIDPRGEYVSVQGTSFSAPAVSGVVALMKGVDPQLSRDRAIAILKETASYDGLEVSPEDAADRPSGKVTPQQYFFGSGLVNAEAAVRRVLAERTVN